MPVLRGRSINRAALLLALALCLAAFGARAAEKQVGQPCSSDNSAIDWDTVSQCNGTTYAKGPLILGAMTNPPYSATTCTSSNAGMIQWTGSVFQGCDGSNWGSLASGFGTALSGLLAATTTNSIDSTNWAQTWKWGTLSTQTALTLTTSSMTTGTLLNLSNTATTANAGTVLNVSTSEAGASYGVHVTNSGAANTGYAGYFTNTATTANYGVYATTASTGAGYGVYGSVTGAANTGYAGYFSNASANGWSIYAPGAAPSYFAGNVGIGTTAPGDLLDLGSTNSKAGSITMRANGTTQGDVQFFNDTNGTYGNGGEIIFKASYAGAYTSFGVQPNTTGAGAGIAVYHTNTGSNNYGYLLMDADNVPGATNAYVLDIRGVGSVPIEPLKFQFEDFNGSAGLASNPAIFMKTQTTGASTFYSVKTSTTPLSVQGISGQTADIFDVQNSTPTTLFNVTASGNVGIGTASPGQALEVNGKVQVDSWAAASATTVCQNSNVLSTCSSSRRYKENIKDANFGLKEISQMRPVTFKWKGRDENDLGFIAEEMEKINPLFVTHERGQIEGVKYPQLTAVIVNAVKEQENTINLLSDKVRRQQEKSEEQQKKIEDLERRFEQLAPTVH